MDLFALGTPVIDLFARVDRKTTARLGLKTGATNFFSSQRLAAIEKSLGRKITYRYAGDNARNVCEGFAALGGFCGFEGAIGDDRWAAEFEANLEECGIANFLQEKNGGTGRILALVTPGGERTFCADLGVSSECDKFQKFGIWHSKAFFATSITLCLKSPVAGLALEYLEACRQTKKKAAISLESPPLVKQHRRMLLPILKKYADIIFMNEEEARALLGAKYALALAKLKPKALVYLKKGKMGSEVFANGKRQKIAAQKADAIDTTGAGDAYAAGVLYGLTRGYSAAGSGKLGSYLAAKAVGKFGAGMPLKHTRIRIKFKKRQR